MPYFKIEKKKVSNYVLHLENIFKAMNVCCIRHYFKVFLQIISVFKLI